MELAVLGFLNRGGRGRAAAALYRAAVAAAREPYFYTALGVPDTLDGRFDLVGLHAFLVIRRLGRDRDSAAARALAQAVFDAMFADMEHNLREIGVGDLSVARKVRQMWEAFHGRAAAYESALNGADPTALPLALARNVWRGAPPATAAERLAAIVRAEDAHLAGQAVSAMLTGQVAFPPAASLAP
jgi:cytochrome b pre-mRNA-processing protein 3